MSLKLQILIQCSKYRGSLGNLSDAVVIAFQTAVNSCPLNQPFSISCLAFPTAGNLNSNGQQLLVYGRHFGNVFIGVQPTFGYEGDPMRLLFSRSASPHHGFAAFYTYLEHVFKVPPQPVALGRLRLTAAQSFSNKLCCSMNAHFPSILEHFRTVYCSIEAVLFRTWPLVVVQEGSLWPGRLRCICKMSFSFPGLL